ncbi:Secretory carrier-associated membrane protein 1 [Apodemus speciosus]|uniref:Secretory carrier-associated membrane protein n=1 Tax=Apodemus speciosus TaxID=105296 RepID=A0ABQ0FGU1_APOSI
MSDFDSNPFADPDLNNPFKDPSVTQVTRNVPPGLDEYNPFSDSRTPPPGSVKMPNVPNTQPAIMKPTEEHPAYTQITKEHALAQAELLKRQEELERKAAELDRREREMQSLSQHGSIPRVGQNVCPCSEPLGRKNNWPPLPSNFPVGPCFYQDFSVDIPVEFQKTVKLMYYLWMFHAVTLFLNIFGCLAWFCVDSSRAVDFGLSILWFLLFTPCSFVCWYRPLYGAFSHPARLRTGCSPEARTLLKTGISLISENPSTRKPAPRDKMNNSLKHFFLRTIEKNMWSDSSFRFFVFFFVYICQFAVHVLQAAGFHNWGNCGWISSLTGLNKNIPVGIMMIIIAALFTASAVISLVMFKKVHGLYRTTGASFEKAQQEFATGVMSNKTVQTAAANAASTAATSAAQNAFKGNQM